LILRLCLLLLSGAGLRGSVSTNFHMASGCVSLSPGSKNE